MHAGVGRGLTGPVSAASSPPPAPRVAGATSASVKPAERAVGHELPDRARQERSDGGHVQGGPVGLPARDAVGDPYVTHRLVIQLLTGRSDQEARQDLSA